MKTFYKKMNFLKLLKLPALIFFMLALSYNVKGDGWFPLGAQCYGTQITLFACPTPPPTNYCASPYTQADLDANFRVSWYYFDNAFVMHDIYTGGSPVVHNLTDAIPPGHPGFTWLSPTILPGDPGYEYIAGNNSHYLELSFQYDGDNFGGEGFNPDVQGPILIGGSITNVLCNGSNTGAITITSLSGGSGSFVAFHWSNGPTTENISNLVAGTYTLTVTDDRTCTGFKSFTITQPTSGGLTVSTTVTNVKCTGNQTGAIATSVNGGAPPFTYLWSTLATTPNIGSLGAGTYTVTVTDQNGCNNTAVRTVTQPASLPGFLATITHVACYGGLTGAITVTPSGGTPPYTYLWSPGSMTTQNLSGLAAGIYVLAITDANGCPVQSGNTVTQPLAPLTVIRTVPLIVCNGGNGCINLTVSGGTSPYTYLWNTGFSGQNLCNLTAGTYSVTVTDNHNCSTVSGGTFNQPPLLTVSTTVTNVKCTGNQTGAIATSVNGGVTPYTYKWSTLATTPNIGSLGVGTYTVTVTDLNGCTSTSIATVTQPLSLPGFLATITHVACYGGLTGAITVTPSGGTPPYTYLWNPGGMTTQNVSGLGAGIYVLAITDFNGCPVQSGNTVTQPLAPLTVIASVPVIVCNGGNGCINLTVSGGTSPYTYLWNTGFSGQNLCNVTAGTYSVTVTDNHNCTTVSGGTFNQPPLLTVSTTVTNVKCTGNQTGAIATSVNGGVTPYTYKWSTLATTPNIGSLGIGTYTVTVTDLNGCTSTSIGTVTQPASLPGFLATITHVACFGGLTGAITVTPSGGTPPYTYLWNPGGMTTQNVSGLGAGIYVLAITDFNGCPVQSGNTVTQPLAPLTVIRTVPLIVCNGGNGCINLTVSGGTSPYTYLWNTGFSGQNLCNVTAGTYSVTVTDNHNCTTVSGGSFNQPPLLTVSTTVTNVKCTGNQTGAIATSVNGGVTPYTYKWSTLATTPNIGSLGVGTYTVTVTDLNGCTSTSIATVTQPASLPGFLATITHVACYGGLTGAITVTPSGGTPPYTYLWNPGGMTTQNVSGLGAGIYVLAITDANGCPVQSGNTVTQPLAPLTVIASVPIILCNGGNGCINLTVSGGTSPYTYLWNTGFSGQNLCNVTAGTYNVTVTDNHNCTTVTGGSFQQPPLLTVSTTVTNVKCTGNQTGAIATSVNGGVTPYTYKWSTLATTPNIGSLGAGTYTVTVTDLNGCTSTSIRTVTQPASLPAFLATITHVACYGGLTGAITVTPSGGTPPYTYLWNPGGMTTQNLSGLAAGLYVLAITDANGCPVQSGNTVTQPLAPLNVIPSVTHILCNNAQTGCITLTVSGGSNPYTYLWNNGTNGNNNCNVTAGTYTVTVTDNHGCTTISGGTITTPTTLTINIAVTNVKCTGNQTGAIATTVNGGTTPYTYKWSTLATTPNLGSLGAGTYTVTVTDLNGCTITAIGIVTQPPTLPAFLASITHVACYGGLTGAITVTASGGTPPYTYLWNPGGMTTQNLSGLSAGFYVLAITDANGCAVQSGNTVTQPLAPLDVVLTPSDISCYNYTNGSIATNVTGGTTPYSYHWSNGKTTANIINLSGGTYCVTVTDAHNCMTVGCASVTQPPEWGPCLPCPLPDQCQGDTVRYCVCRTGFFADDQIIGDQFLFYPSSFEWTVTGGTIIEGCCDTCITVVWNHCDSGIICVTEIRHDPPYDGCRMTKCCTVHLNPVPTPLIIGPLTVWGDSITSYTTTFSSCYLYSWSVTGGVVVSGQGTNTIGVQWTQCGSCDLGVITVCVTDACHPTMCCGCSSIDILIISNPSSNLQGYVTYANPYNTPLNGVVIQLIDSVGHVVSTQSSGPNFSNGSGAPGYYSFNNIPAGHYTMHITFDGTWGGVNATDALLIELHTAHIITLTGLPLLAGDVTADFVVNSTDALWVKLRTVGMVHSFPAGDWVFNNGIITIPSSGIVVYPIGALCFGDVNESYIPQGMKEGSFLNVIDDGIMNIPVNQSFNYTIRSSKSAELGAMTLFLGYDQSRFEVENVSTSLDGIRYKVNDSRIAVAWSNPSPLTLNSNDPILTLQLKAKEAVSQPSQIFAINSGSEVADATAKVLDNFDLKMSSVVTPNGGKEFYMYNRPNPFQNTTEIVYSLPEQGHVKLVITNMFGMILSTLVDADQVAGSYQVKVDPTVINLSSGVYLYKIVVDGVTTSFNKTNKMLFTR